MNYFYFLFFTLVILFSVSLADENLIKNQIDQDIEKEDSKLDLIQSKSEMKIKADHHHHHHHKHEEIEGYQENINELLQSFKFGVDSTNEKQNKSKKRRNNKKDKEGQDRHKSALAKKQMKKHLQAKKAEKDIEDILKVFHKKSTNGKSKKSFQKYYKDSSVPVLFRKVIPPRGAKIPMVHFEYREGTSICRCNCKI